MALTLLILMQKSFWWSQCSDRYIISLSPHLHTPFPLLTVPNQPYGFCGRKATLNHASALVTLSP